LHPGSGRRGNGGSPSPVREHDLSRACGERTSSRAPSRSICGWAAASAFNSRTQKGHQSPQKKLTTTGPRSRRSERSMKPPGPHRSLNRGAISPAFAALATRPVSASAWIERRIAATASGAAFASYWQRHVSSCAFNLMERHRASGRACGASLIPADPRQPCRGNIVYSERE
jgi:hypothetical protein